MTRMEKVWIFIKLIVLLLPLTAFIIAPAVCYSQNVLFLLPEEVIDSYFPYSELYFIPVDPEISQLIERAEKYENNQYHEQASRYYLTAYKKVENSTKAPYILFKQSILLNNVEASTAGLIEIIEKYPLFPLIDAVRYELSMKLFLQEDYESARKYLIEIEEHEISGVPIFTPYVYTFLGIINRTKEDFIQASEYFYRSIDILSYGGGFQKELSIVRNYLEIARLLHVQKSYEYLEDFLKRIIGSTSSSLLKQEALFLLGQYYENIGDTILAYSTFSTLINEHSATLFSLKAKEKIDNLQITAEQETFEISGIYDRSILDGGYRVGQPEATSPIEIDYDTEISEKEAGGYFIQVGSFTDQKNAEKLTRILKDQGFPAYTVSASVANRTVFRVRVGSYNNRQEAERMGEILVDSGYQIFIGRAR